MDCCHLVIMSLYCLLQLLVLLQMQDRSSKIVHETLWAEVQYAGQQQSTKQEVQQQSN